MLVSCIYRICHETGQCYTGSIPVQGTRYCAHIVPAVLTQKATMSPIVVPGTEYKVPDSNDVQTRGLSNGGHHVHQEKPQ